MRWIAVCTSLVVFACGSAGAHVPTAADGGDEGTTAPLTRPVRNVILVIGDGMGPQQLGLLETWARLASSSPYAGPTAFETLAERGSTALSLTHPEGGLVVDSACSATQLATGRMAALEVVGLDARGDVVQTVLEAARDSGRATGLVSDTRLTHATPASFAAHVPHRREENEIAVQLVESGVDVMLGGGLRHFVPAGTTQEDGAIRVGGAFPVSSRRDDDRDLVTEAVTAGYRLVYDREGLADAVEEGEGRVLGLFANGSMTDALDARMRSGEAGFGEPALEDMALAALELLDRDPDGFFVMIEAGQIDWAGHDNDAGWMLHEMIRLERTVAAVLGWAEGRDDTLVIVTADHETGGFGFSYSGASLPEPTTLPGDGMMEQPFVPQFNFGDRAVLDVLFNQSQTLGRAFEQFDGLSEPSPDALTALIRATLGVDFRREDAERVLQTEPNPHRTDGHEYLDSEHVARIDDFDAFYVYADGARPALVSRVIADELGVVWATGTHTSTPVPVFAHGPEVWQDRIRGILHHAELGGLMFEAMGLR